MKQVFIKTSDQETAEKLQEAGFSIINYDDPFWIFLNDSSLTFESNKINYTDKLNI